MGVAARIRGGCSRVPGASRRVLGGAAAFLLAAAASAAVAVGWAPFRTGHSNVEVALLLVLVMTAAGASCRRCAVAGAVVAASASFTFFDTEPYERFVISRQPDLATAVSLVVVGLLTGELALRVARNRRGELSAVADLGRVRQAAALVANGEELVVLIGAVVEELTGVAHLRGCTFSTEPLPGGTPVVDRRGRIVPAGGSGEEVALPVWALGDVVGHFLLRCRPGDGFRSGTLQVAVTLADQVGAALAAQAPPPPLPPPDAGPPAMVPLLRVLRRP